MIRSTLIGGALLVAALLTDGAKAQTSDLVSKSALRVCADPANMPFSNKAGEGYENKIAELLADKLGLPLQYTWFPMATGFIRRTLRENRCDVVIGYAQGHELVLNTNHYYVSTHALVVDPDGPYADVETLADPALKDARLGIVAGSPVATHAAKNGLIGKAKPYNLMVDRRIENPAGDMLADLRAGEIDGALMWGPVGGYLAAHGGREMKVIPLTAEKNVPKLFYRITMGVRQGELVWKRKLNSLIRRNQEEIDAILRDYGVPLVDEYGAPLTAEAQ
jgi:quinoprotein dehydrogenase-associated probable ABC transporter substrate-binding protein